MQHEHTKDTAVTAGGMGRRSTLERLPSALRGLVDTAIEDGATIDELVALIRAHDGDCSRSAVGRYAKKTRGQIRQKHYIDRCIETWLRVLGERAEGSTGLIAIEALRTLTLATATKLGEDEEPAAAAEVARLALALRNIESADRLRTEREREAAKAAGPAPQKGGLSDDAVALIRRAVQGEFFPSS